jgi:hypothetical protein
MNKRRLGLACSLLVIGCTHDAAEDDEGGSAEGGHHDIPDVPRDCEGFDAQDVSAPTKTISGGDCNETAIRTAIEAGGTIVIDCPDPVAFTSQITIGSDTTIRSPSPRRSRSAATPRSTAAVTPCSTAVA